MKLDISYEKEKTVVKSEMSRPTALEKESNERKRQGADPVRWWRWFRVREIWNGKSRIGDERHERLGRWGHSKTTTTIYLTYLQTCAVLYMVLGYEQLPT